MSRELLITDLTVERLGPYQAETSVSFSNALTFLVGPNGAGKSSLLLSVYLVNVMTDVAMERLENLSRDETPLGLKRTIFSGAAFVHRRDPSLVEVAGVSWTPVNGTFDEASKVNYVTHPNFSIISAFLPRTETRDLSLLTSRFHLLDPTPAEISEGMAESRVTDSKERGSYIAQSYARATEDQKENITRALREIAPEIDEILPFDVGGRSWVNFRVRGKDLSAMAMSAGTLRAFAILTALETTPDGHLLLIEEPDAYIDPNAIGVIRDALLANAERLQIIATTHSPELLASDDITSDMIRLVHRTSSGSVVKELPERLARAIDDQTFTAGSLMQSGAFAEDA